MTEQTRPITTAATARTPLDQWVMYLTNPHAAVSPDIRARLASGVPVSAPGSVLGALIAEGVVSDVTIDGTEEEAAWAAASTWTLRSSVPRHADGRSVRLVFDGIDTLATVRVDGETALETDNMFHRWVVELGVDDVPGVWDIEVEFHPAEPEARRREASNPLPRADMYELPYNQVRKMACSFGWDWGPTTMTAGLYRAVHVERTGAARLERVLLNTAWHDAGELTADVVTHGACGRIGVAVTDRESAVRLAAKEVEVVNGAAHVKLAVPNARRWDVAGRGDQPLYDVTVTALDCLGAVLDTHERRIGFRTVSVVQEHDAVGRSFEVHVNGSRVWARGFNWIPADVLPERVTRDKVRKLVSEAAATGANMLRVWGGGVVESDHFYDACDERGVLVWQDFSFACAAYAEDAAAASAVEREVEDAVRRVGHRASLALWCGCNENLWGYEDWGWKDKLGGGPWGQKLYYDVIPAALAPLDPSRPYIPGSPFSRDSELHPNDETQGTTHHWDTWNQLDYAHFENKSSRFASEFGWQAPASWPTLATALGHAPESGADADVQRLQKHPEGQAALDRAVAGHVPHLPQDGRGWYFSTQLVQARAIRAAIGRFRSLHDTCSGALWWQLDDCWPALSWSVIDVAGRRKLGWYAAAETMTPRAVVTTADGVNDGLTLVNDLPQPWAVAGWLRVIDDDGVTLAKRSLDIVVPADGYTVVAPTELPVGAAAVVVDAGSIRGVRWLRDDLDLSHAPAVLSVTSTQPSDGVVRVTVTAETLARDTALLAEMDPRLPDARVDGQLALLLPGESATFDVAALRAGEISGDEWAAMLACDSPITLR